MMGVFIYVGLASAAIFLFIGARRKNRLGVSLGVLFFSFSLGALGIVHTHAGSYWLGIMYGIAAVSQLYAAVRTWQRWPLKTSAVAGDPHPQ